MRSNDILKTDFFRGKRLNYIVFDGTVFWVDAEGISEPSDEDGYKVMLLSPVHTTGAGVLISYFYHHGVVSLCCNQRVRDILEFSKCRKYKINRGEINSAIRRLYA